MAKRMARIACFTFALFFALPLFMHAQEASLPSPPKKEPWFDRIYTDVGFGYAALPASLMEFGDPSVTAVPNAYGFTRSAGAGIELFSGIRFGFVYERVTVHGIGAFAQNGGGAQGKFRLAPDSRMAYGEFDLWPRKRFHPFVTVAGGLTHVLHNFTGNSNPMKIYMEAAGGEIDVPSEPVWDIGMDHLWDFSLGGGIAHSFKNCSCEIRAGIFGKDSINAKVSFVYFPARMLPHVRKLF